MTNEEAIKILRQKYRTVSQCVTADECRENNEAIRLAIAALERDTPKRPHKNYPKLSAFWCECGWHLGSREELKFCPKCGHPIDWTEPPKEET